MNTALSGGRPQIVSFVPSENRLETTVRALQLVVVRLVVYSGFTLQVFVPVERTTRFELTERLTIWIVGGVGGGWSMVIICAPKPWIEQTYVKFMAGIGTV